MSKYNEIKNQGIFWLNEILPNLVHRVEGQISFGEYLKYFYPQSQPHSFGIPNAFFYDINFLKDFKDKCVTFYYNSPDDVQRGAAPLSAIYQFSPTLHALANIHYWREDEKSEMQIGLYFIYESIDEVKKFIEENMKYAKQDKESKPVGLLFSALPQGN